MYHVFVALAIGLILLNWIWQLFKNYGLGAGIEAEDPVKLTLRSVLFILLAYFADEIVDIVLKIGGTPYRWILNADLPALQFADFHASLLVILSACATGAVSLIALILTLILAWNYIKLLFDAAKRYVQLGVLVFTAPIAAIQDNTALIANMVTIYTAIDAKYLQTLYSVLGNKKARMTSVPRYIQSWSNRCHSRNM